MDRIAITGGNKLFGEIPISGAKNAALPLMTACLLTDGPLSLSNIPHLADISLLAELLAQLGVDVTLTATGAEGAAGRVMRLTTSATSRPTGTPKTPAEMGWMPNHRPSANSQPGSAARTAGTWESR